jgi:hypothetical protein
MPTLDRRQLNRATLARQLLLDRSDRAPVDAVAHLVGIQSQAPLSAYVALWSRLAAFDPYALSRALDDRAVVRTHMMRSTIHLVTAADALDHRGAFHVTHMRTFASSNFARALAGVAVADVVDAGASLLRRAALTRTELADALAERYPGYDKASLAYAVTYCLPTVQPPPRGRWRERGPAAWTLLDHWLGRSPDPTLRTTELVKRYLRAFGPATVGDAQAWSGLARLREVFDRLGEELVRFRSADGADLYDVPDGPRPDVDVPVPVRFLPEYDNVLLSYADRTRINPDRRPVPLPPGDGARTGTFLVDGDLRGTWRLSGGRVEVDAVPPLRPSERDDVAAEATRLEAFLAG